MGNFDSDILNEAMKITGTGTWRLEIEEGKPNRLYADSIMSELIGLSCDMPPEDRVVKFYKNIHPDDEALFREYNESLMSGEKSEIVYRYIHPVQGVIYVRCIGKLDKTVTNCVCFRGVHQVVDDTMRIDLENMHRKTADAMQYQNMAFRLMKSFSEEALYINLETGSFDWVVDVNNSKQYAASADYMEMADAFAMQMPEEYRGEYLFYSRLDNMRERLLKDGEFAISTYLRFYDQQELQRVTLWFFPLDEDCKQVLSISKNTTEEYKKEQMLANALTQAKEANRAKTKFLNNMSHDIRTPMNAIMGFTNLAKNNLEDTEKCREYLGKIEMSSKYLLSLINDVLDMSRIESGKMHVVMEEFSVVKMLSELSTIAQSGAEDRGLKFSIDSSKIKNDRIIGDKLRLNRVILNCVSNSIKFTEPGGEVSVTVSQEEIIKPGFGCYRFVIKDTGIGMSKEFLERIFEPFAREESSHVNQIQGTGLGMAICKSFVELMGGRMSIQSEPGVGTEFDITIAFEFAKSSINDVFEATESDVADLNGLHVLLVEDNELNREIALEILKDTGAIMDVAENGQIAVDKVMASEEGYYSMILMDVQMPVMNGYEASMTIRGLDRTDAKSIRIVAMTANTFDEDKQKAMNSGMDAHVAKPLDIKVLMDTLKIVL